MRGTTRTPRAAALVAVLVALTAIARPAAAATHDVHVGAMYFEDDTRGDGKVTIQAGDRISFTFDDGPHTATVDGLFDSGQQNAGRTYVTDPLTRAGTYTLYCRAHGAQEHSTTLLIRSTTPSPSPTRKASPRPSPRPSPKPSPATTRTRPPASASPSPPPSRSPSPSPSRSAPPSASASASPSALELPFPPETGSPDAVTTPSPVGPAPAPSTADVDRATPVADGGRGWELPALLVLILGAGAGAIALGRRRTG